jgi:type IV secretory pathway TraG/TraD family ATPase VirD4
MNVPIRPKSGPVNRMALGAGFLAAAAWHFESSAASWICLAAAVPPGWAVLSGMCQDYRLRRNLERAARASADHGAARQASWAELVARGMDDPASGNFLGLYEEIAPAFAPPRTPFSLIEMPPGVGKTVNYVIGSILHQARLGKSLFIPDVKCELAPMLVGALRATGAEVWCINPAGAHKELCGDTPLNLYETVLDAAYAPDNFRLDTVKLAFDLADLHLPENKNGEDRNVYFRNGSRRCIAIAILSQALIDPVRCTPSDVFALLNDPVGFQKRLMFLRHELSRLMADDPIAEFLKTESSGLLRLFQDNPENASSFLEGATQRLLTFNQGGRMAGYGRAASHNIADMRNRQIVTFVMAPLSHARDFAPVVSLLTHSLLEAAKRNPAGHPIHIVGEEALNFRFADLASDMETMRGLKISADLYIQSFDGLVRKYGRDAASAIESYCDVKIYAGLNSLARAKHVSDMLAESTIRRQDYSYQAEAEDISVSSRELGRRLMMPDEILAMDRGKAWVFVRGLRPVLLSMADYGRVSPWRDEVADNPLEGTRLSGSPVFAIRYESGGKPALDRKRTPKPEQQQRFVWPVRAKHLLWLPLVVGMFFVGPAALPTPHLRIAGVYIGSPDAAFFLHCDYAGLHSRRVSPPDGQCPPVAFFRSP